MKLTCAALITGDSLPSVLLETPTHSEFTDAAPDDSIEKRMERLEGAMHKLITLVHTMNGKLDGVQSFSVFESMS